MQGVVFPRTHLKDALLQKVSDSVLITKHRPVDSYFPGRVGGGRIRFLRKYILKTFWDGKYFYQLHRVQHRGLPLITYAPRGRGWVVKPPIPFHCVKVGGGGQEIM